MRKEKKKKQEKEREGKERMEKMEKEWKRKDCNRRMKGGGREEKRCWREGNKENNEEGEIKNGYEVAFLLRTRFRNGEKGEKRRERNRGNGMVGRKNEGKEKGR